jgi:hypothetical protein
MEISHGLELTQSPTLGAPFILLRHKIEIGQPIQPVPRPQAPPSDLTQFKSEWKSLLARIEYLESAIIRLQAPPIPWWQRLINWLRSL